MVLSKAFENVIRPALHVQMGWIPGHVVEFAVADADMQKNTAGNIETISRMLDAVFRKHKTLPPTINLVMDNTSRENKNQLMLKFWIKVVCLEVTQQVLLSFPMVGHTHGPLDALGGQAVTACSNSVFEDDRELVRVYNNYLSKARFESNVHRQGAYKLDQCANWQAWVEEIPLVFRSLTGPKAPHLFRILQRQHLQMEDLEVCTAHRQSEAPGDIMVCCHSHMSDKVPFQVVCVLDAAKVNELRSKFTIQPTGIAPRRSISYHDRQLVQKRAAEAYELQAISKTAHDYLTAWIQGTRRRDRRPSEYSWLGHRMRTMDPLRRAPINPHAPQCPRVIQVLQADGSICAGPPDPEDQGQALLIQADDEDA